MKTRYILYLLLLVVSNGVFSCKPSYDEPQISLEDYHIQDGLELSVVASEPFLDAPVAIDFDLKGRIWVAELRGYMRNLDGEHEDAPSGKISILEDLDGDGVMDHSKVFLDSLVLPRALALVYNGLLYAEPPNLWFVEINNDQPGKKVLVDSLYAEEGNVEHQPNGLMMNIDNWIYNADSHYRYQRKNGKWLKEPTSFRGQWGISRDDFGRLYYNSNSILLQGDFVLPNTVIRNPYFTPKESVGKVLTENQNVFPNHVTFVNRGYEKGVLNEDSVLVNATSACGPLIYRGGQFPSEFHQNAFVCVPEGNLIKRLTLDFNEIQTKATPSYESEEFLVSTDEAFRPVNLNNGPDGSIYVTDMHRGVIQHGAYLTPYLRKHLEEAGMDKIIGMGRILKISSKSAIKGAIPDLASASVSELVTFLYSENGWLQDKAHHQILLRASDSDRGILTNTAFDTAFPIAQIHALHLLGGLGMLSEEVLVKVVSEGNNLVASHGLYLMSLEKKVENSEALANLTTLMLNRFDIQVEVYLMAALRQWVEVGDTTFKTMLHNVANMQINPVSVEMGVSTLANMDMSGMAKICSPDLDSLLTLARKQVVEEKKNWIFDVVSVAEDDRTRGMRLFKQICAACHGPGGAGIEGQAPPLRNSEYLTGSGRRLALIVLHGLKGPVTVNGTRYELPAEMPGLVSNTQLSDQDISDLITYLSNAFGRSVRETDAEMIKELRAVKSKGGGAFTEEEL